MSTPTRKPFDSISSPGHAMRNSNGESDRGASSSGDDDDAQVSPYAPKRPRVIRPAWDASKGLGEEASRLSVEGRASRSQSAEPRSAPRDQTLPRAVDLDLGSPLKFDADRHQGHDEGAAKWTGAAPANDEPEADIERIEASLRWLQRQSADLQGARSHRSTAERRPLDTRASRQAASSRAPRSLEPENLVSPALMRAQRSSLRGPMMILLASLVAVPIAYFVVGQTSTAPEPTRGPRLAAALPSRPVEPPAAAPAPNEEPSVATPEVAAPQAATPAREIANAWPTAAAPRPAPQVEPAPAPAAGASEPQPTQPAMPVRELDPGAIRLLMQQGEQFMSTGDVVSARVVFQRAAEARDPSAALAMGATYDPLLLSKIGAVGVSADVEKARFWYEKAKEFGSQEAPRRLELLAKR